MAKLNLEQLLLKSHQNLHDFKTRKEPDYDFKKEFLKKEFSENNVTGKFEQEVFKQLPKLNEYGLLEFEKLKNSRIDGLLKLKNGNTILLEIKYRLGWYTCCNARIEFEGFRNWANKKFKIQNIIGGLIIFNGFSRGWDTKRKNNVGKIEMGWAKFYQEEGEIRSNFPVSIIKLNKKFEFYPKGLNT